MLVVGTVDFGRVFYKGMAVAQAARAGAEYAAQSVDKSTDTTGVKSAAENAVASDLTLADGDITLSRTCECATDAGAFSATSPANTCAGSPCTSGHLVITVSVTAAKTFTTMVNYPLIPHTVSITRATKIRVQ
jgi:Flp pilus assembly protein TadG